MALRRPQPNAKYLEIDTYFRQLEELISGLSGGHARLHDMNGVSDHTSPGGTTDNVVLFDASGYPVKESAVTDTELETLTNGSNADSLHVHSGTGSIAHVDTTGQTANDHHNESHTIVSHSDTTATGTELETLTNGSNADLLHVHASSGSAEGHFEIIDTVGGNTAVDENGNWRFFIDGNDMKFQRRESGSWVDKGGVGA